MHMISQFIVTLISLLISLHSIISDKFVKYHDGSNLSTSPVSYVNRLPVLDNRNPDIVRLHTAFDGSFAPRNSRDNVFPVEAKVFFKRKHKNGYWSLTTLILGNIFRIKVILH